MERRGETPAFFSMVKYYIDETGACSSEHVVYAMANRIKIKDDGTVVHMSRTDEKHISVAGVPYDVPLVECVPVPQQVYAALPLLLAALAAFFGLMFIKRLSETAINEIN